jgi:RNA polymerase sigma factor for flagellar operon FliA
MREKTKKVEAAIERLEQQNLRTVSPKEVAEEIGFTENEVTSVMSESFLANVLSIDEENKETDSREKVSYTIEDKKVITPENSLLQEELHMELASVIKEHSKALFRIRQVLKRYM